MENLATVMGRAISVPLTLALRGVTQTPGPATPKSKIPSPEKFDGEKGPTAKSFILDCKVYFLANPSSFQTDHSHISFVLMNLKEGQPKKWGQIYLEKLIDGTPEPILVDWDSFEAAFLHNWSDPATLQIEERRLRELKQTKSATDYATEFRIIAGDLESSDAALMASFCQGLEKEVRGKLIEFTLYQNITTLDALISTACLIDDTLFEAKRETQGSSSSSPSSNKSPGNKSGNFVSRKIQEARRKAGQCTKCGDKSHKWKDCKNGWHLKASERSQSESAKLAQVEELPSTPNQGKE
ncbi:hypothetical protein OPQ81_003761 [Rhizoctonia solani]|nr:hypothetical protein OPQ81_003761 [Rhizoctonia solani]